MDLQHEDLDLNKAFGIILSIESFNNYISDIAELIYNGTLNRDNLNKILNEYGISRIESIKEETLDLLIIYINLILNDQVISENEKRNIEFLKKYFKIKEGDFYNLRKDEVDDIIKRQFVRLYCDQKIDEEEAIYNVELQGLFDLSYDQYDKIKENEVIRAIEAGVDITSLDTARFPNSLKFSIDTNERGVSQQVRDSVYSRDRGMCRICGSTEELEFEYIIPFSKGGSNTARNIQLLCEKCKRSKYHEE